VILVENLSKTFGNRKVLDQVSFTIPSGQCLFVLGKSGVGKSVLLKHIVGLIAPDEGKIRVGELEVDVKDPRALQSVRKQCGLVFQFPALLDSVTVFENVAFGLRARGIAGNTDEIETRVKKELIRVGLEDSILEKYPAQLSYVAQKRVSIARTLAVAPDYLLFDEPTTGMDLVATSALNSLIQKLVRELRVTTVVVSHDIKSALKISDRIILLENGKIVFDGSPEKFKTSDVKLAREFIVGCNYGS